KEFLMHLTRLTALVLLLAAAGPASAADFPKGTFTITGPDKATWAVTFDGKGKYTVSRDGEVGVEGAYKASKDEISFTDEKGRFSVEKTTGTYKWKLDGKKLSFTKVKDDSKGRATILTSGPWTKKE